MRPLIDYLANHHDTLLELTIALKFATALLAFIWTAALFVRRLRRRRGGGQR